MSAVPQPFAGAMAPAHAAVLDEQDLIQRLRDGDERVFVALSAGTTGFHLGEARVG